MHDIISAASFKVIEMLQNVAFSQLPRILSFIPQYNIFTMYIGWDLIGWSKIPCGLPAIELEANINARVIWV